MIPAPPTLSVAKRGKVDVLLWKLPPVATEREKQMKNRARNQSSGCDRQRVPSACARDRSRKITMCSLYAPPVHQRAQRTRARVREILVPNAPHRRKKHALNINVSSICDSPPVGQER